MTIEQIAEARRELEQNIGKLVREFEENTGVEVYSLQCASLDVTKCGDPKRKRLPIIEIVCFIP